MSGRNARADINLDAPRQLACHRVGAVVRVVVVVVLPSVAYLARQTLMPGRRSSGVRRTEHYQAF